MTICSLSPSSFSTEEAWLRKHLLQYNGDTQHPLIRRFGFSPFAMLILLQVSFSPFAMLILRFGFSAFVMAPLIYSLLPNMDDAFAK